MKIAITSNLRTEEIEEQAEFDSQDTIDFMTKNLEELGHQVKFIDLTHPLVGVIQDLIDYKPDLIFNTSEGTKGKYRESFWPGIFEELGLLYTGSDPFTLALSLDKNLTKQLVAKHGVPTPQAEMVYPGFIPDLSHLHFPIIAKPNYEGSSKGITQDSVIEDLETLQKRLPDILKKYPDGILVEEYIFGKDITVPFLENLVDPILDVVEYIVDPEFLKTRRYQIYDYEMKNNFYDSVDIQIANLTDDLKQQIKVAAQKVIKSLNCRDLGRMDFRLTPDGKIYFLEINCLPYLDEGVSLYLSAAKQGLSHKDVFNHIIQSAMKRAK
ncbi:MAG: hypothetical protein NTU97_05020 [Candidatus Magasanikbacteria bacterium]|nr:hypothetical protein [Candidatus Magasanikbacteria bacterium]